ncbi:MAG: hypothetical protein ABIU58_11395 [Ramlibacter sp.]
MDDNHWLTRSATIKRLWIVLIAVLALTVVAEFWVVGEPHFALEHVFAFNAIYGFLVCAAMILGAKALGVLLKRRESYYDERIDD